MGLKIKNQKRFFVAVVGALALFILLLVSFFTLIGTIFGFSTEKKEAPMASVPTPTVQTAKGLDVTSPDSVTVLINKNHPLPADYIPADLVEVSLRGSRVTMLRKVASDALTNLFAAAEEDGVLLYCASGYRDYTIQEEIYNNNVSELGEGVASTVSAKPGQSEHQTGLCMDLSCEQMDMELTEEFAKLPEGQWVAENAHEFGFIVRFPEGKTALTGYAYEPWHIRYVGPEIAAAMKASGQSYEEYLGTV